MPEGEDGPVPGFIDFVEVGVAFGLPADRSADDGDADITDPTNKPRLQTIHFLLATRYRACIRAAHVLTGCALSHLHSHCSCSYWRRATALAFAAAHATEKETHTDFADLTCEIRDIRGSLFWRSAAISP